MTDTRGEEKTTRAETWAQGKIDWRVSGIWSEIRKGYSGAEENEGRGTVPHRKMAFGIHSRANKSLKRGGGSFRKKLGAQRGRGPPRRQREEPGQGKESDEPIRPVSQVFYRYGY